MTFTKKLNLNTLSTIWQRLKQNSTLMCVNEDFQFEKTNNVWLKKTKKTPSKYNVLNFKKNFDLKNLLTQVHIKRNLEINDYNFSCSGHMRMQTL
jgi:hypothetical protein